MSIRLEDVIQRGTRAAQPAATTVPVGTIYFVTDETVTERSNGTIWQSISDTPGGGTDHGVLTGLTDDDHTQYVLVTDLEVDRATITTNWDDLTDGGATTLHSHSGGSYDATVTSGVSEFIQSNITTESWEFILPGTGVAVTVEGDTGSAIRLSTVDSAIDHSALANLTTGDPHTQYRLESEDHTHQSTGAQAGQLDHGLALTGLTDDDHSAYLLASDATNRATFAANWIDLTDGGATTLHSHAGGSYNAASTEGISEFIESPLSTEPWEFILAGTGIAITIEGESGKALRLSTVDSAIDHGSLAGLADDDHTQYLLHDGTQALTADWDAGSFEIRAQTLESDVTTGTAPLTIASTTKVTNLNVDLLDDQSGAYYLDSANFTGTNWTDLTDAGETALHNHFQDNFVEAHSAAPFETAIEENSALSAINVIIDGGGSAITTGIKADITIPFNCTTLGNRILADQTGSIVIDIWKNSLANYPPTDADSITASAPPTLTTATKSEDVTLTGWTKTINSGDILRFNVDSITTVTRVTLALMVIRI